MQEELFEKSAELAIRLRECVDYPACEDSERVRVSDVLCSLSFEHTFAALLLASQEFLPSALVVHRSQFEALVRSMWVLFAASDDEIARLGAELTKDSEQLSASAPGVAKMMKELAKKAPPNAFRPLDEFKRNGWDALNSFVHAGIHPIHRHERGVPPALVHAVTININGVACMAAMQAAALTGLDGLQREVLAVVGRYPDCMPEIRGKDSAAG